MLISKGQFAFLLIGWMLTGGLLAAVLHLASRGC